MVSSIYQHSYSPKCQGQEAGHLTLSGYTLKFEVVNKPQNVGKLAKCKKCDKEMQGIVRRLKLHQEKCQTEEANPTVPGSSSTKTVGK